MIETTTHGQGPWDQRQTKEASTPGACDVDGHCVTCSDEALDARVLRVDAASGLALVAMQDATMEVDTTLVDEVQPGDVLLVHAGVAIARVDAS